MHILFITPYTPNVIRTRPYNLVRELSRKGHHITLLTLHSNPLEQAELTSLQDERISIISERLTRTRTGLNVISAIPKQVPVQSAYCWQPELGHRLEEAIEQSASGKPIDIIHVEHLRGARYALHARSIMDRMVASSAGNSPRHNQTIPIVWDSVDSISHLFRQTVEHNKGSFGRWIARFELPRTERYEGWLVWQFDATLTTSAIDREVLLHQAAAYGTGLPPIHVMPNGVDLEYFRPNPSIEREPATLLLTGKFSYHANVNMALYLVNEVMPLVWARRPEVLVQIAGKDPAPAVRALTSNAAVTVTGTVPDLRPYLHRATLALAPITYGAGIQNKVLEAMASGTPVIASPLAARALSAEQGREIVIGSNAPAFADAIISLLSDPEKRLAIATAGREYVESHHRWSDIVTQLEGIYASNLSYSEPGTESAAR